MFLWPLLLAAPFLTFSEYFPHWLIGIATAGLTISVVYRLMRADASQFPLLVLFLPLLIAGGFALWTTSSGALTLEKVLALVFGVATFIFFSTPSGDKELHVFWIRAFIGGVIVLGLLGPFIADFRFPTKLFDTRAVQFQLFHSGEILDANILGCLLALAIPLAVAPLLFRSSASSNFPFLGYMAVGVLLLLLLFSQSRASLVGAGAAILVLLVIRYKKVRLFTLGLIPVVCLLVYWYGYAALLEPIAQSTSLRTLGTRMELWDHALLAIQDFPITGIGAGNFQRIISEYYPLFLLPPDQPPFHSHNLFIQVAMDTGLPGLAAFSLFVSVILFQPFYRGWNTSFLVPGLSAAWIAFLVNGLFDTPLWLNKPHPVPFFLLAVLAQSVAEEARPRVGRLACAGWKLQSLWLLAWWLVVSLLAVSVAAWSPLLSVLIATGGGVGLGWVAAREGVTRQMGNGE